MAWHRKISAFTVILALGAMTMAKAEQAAALTLTEADDGRNVTVHRGDVIEIRLMQNASTGYVWTPETETSPALVLTGETVERPEAPSGAAPPGAPGFAVFHFRAAAPGSSAVRLKYWRSWEGDASIVARYAVTLTID